MKEVAGATFEAKVRKKCALIGYIYIYGVKSLRLIGFRCRRIFSKWRGRGFLGLYFNPKSLRQLQRRKPFSQNFLMDLKEEERTVVGGWQGAEKKGDVCETWYNDLGNSNVFLPSIAGKSAAGKMEKVGKNENM